jgi:nucleoside-diphosphate-sugar epimerase
VHVLVIGGTRFVGYHLVWRLLAAGRKVTLLNRGLTPDPFGDRVGRILCDRTTADLQRLLAGRRFDATVDFAAYGAADVKQLLELPLGHYVLISTGQVYLVRQHPHWPARERDYDGPTMGEPADHFDRAEWVYGMGKRAIEDLLARAPGFPSTRIRIPMVNGERDHYRRVESYLWRILDGGAIVLPDGGAHPTRHVYGPEVARWVAELLGNPKTFGQAYNVCQREEPTLSELVTILARLLGVPPRPEAVPIRKILACGLEPAHISPFSGRWMSRLDPTRAERELGFVHEPLESYLGKIVASFVAHPPPSPPGNYTFRNAERALSGRAP